MNFKKYISIFCAAAIIVCAAGCKSNETAGTSADTTEATTAPVETTSAPTSAPAFETTAAASSVTSDTTAETTTVTSAAADETVMFTTSETTAVTTAPASTATTTTTTSVTTTASASETKTDAQASPAVPDPKDFTLTLTPVYGQEYLTPNSMDEAVLTISYTGSDDAFFTTGSDYRIEKLTDGSWKDFGFSEGMCWNALAHEISKRSSAYIEISFYSSDYEDDFTEGTYRVVKNISGVDMYCEFEVLSDNYHENESGTTELRIREIKPDMFVCELPWPYYEVYYVMCDTSKYPDFCVGDVINVEYSGIKPVEGEDDEFYYYAVNITPGSFVIDPDVDYKPVIYLYPEKPEQVSVKLDYNGTLTLTDPEYKNGWDVTAYPDGRIISGGKEYPYLFWEGRRSYDIDVNSGFCVSGEDTEAFLREKLAYLGLNGKETDDFLDFWLPLMKGNRYNVIHFAAEQYTDNAKLDISPSPDTLIRVFMVFTASDEFVDIPMQQLEKAPVRTGFTVVEWGGGSLKQKNALRA